MEKEFDFCPKCGRYDRLAAHTCPPQWLVGRIGEDEEDMIIVSAASSAEAAERWAKFDDRDSVEYQIVRGELAEVRVINKDSGESHFFVVEGESVPLYSARPIDPPGEAQDK